MKQAFTYAIIFVISSFDLQAQSSFYNAIYWGTYYNDSANYPTFNFAKTDLIDQIVVDKSSGSIFVVGQSFAPPSDSVLSVCSGSQTIGLRNGNGYLAKFNRCGELQWSTFLGKKTLCLALDVQNGKTIVYIAGNVKPDEIPGPPAFKCDGSSSPIFQTENVDHSEAFIAKYEDDGASFSLLRWTYLGGYKIDSTTGEDNIYSMAIYKHNVFVVGTTASIDLANFAQHKADSIKADGLGDAFIAEFDSMLSTLKFFTYAGAEGVDRFHDIEIYSKGKNYVALYASGTTTSSSEIASGTGFDQTYTAPDDGFVQMWEDNDHDGTFTKTWGTYIGGSGDDHSRASKVDANGNVILTGFTRSTDLPVSSLAYDQVFEDGGIAGSTADAYVIKINKNGGKEWCTYFGTKKDEKVNGLEIFSKQGEQYVAIAGVTNADSSVFPLVNSLQAQLNGNGTNKYDDAYIAIFDDVTTTQQQLIQCTYIGGSKMEGIQTGKSYHPSLAMGANKELFMVLATESSDFDSIMATSFKHLVHPYSGGADAFIVKLVDSTVAKQTSCTFADFNRTIENVEPAQVMSLFPNPFRDEISILISSRNDEDGYVEVFDAIGKLIMRQRISLLVGQNQLSLNIAGLCSGNYFVRLITDRQNIVKKEVKE